MSGGVPYGTTGGNMTSNTNYRYQLTFTTARGETLPGNGPLVMMQATDTAVDVGWGWLTPAGDPRVTGRKLYRTAAGGTGAYKLVATIPNNTQTTWKDTLADSAIVNNAQPPTQDSTADPGTMQPFNQVPISSLPIGPAGTTGRRLYRTDSGQVSPGGLVATIGNNSTTTHLDVQWVPGAAPPPTNSTGTPYRTVPLTQLALGPAGTTGRRLYRRFNLAGTFKRVVTIGNNTTTSYTDTVPNSSLGPDAPTSNTTGTATQKVPVHNIPLGPAGVTGRRLYRRFNGAGTFKLVTTIANNTATSYTDTVPNNALGVGSLVTATAVANRTFVSWPAAGHPDVTFIQLHRTAVGSSQLRFLQNFSNVAGSYTDATPDASLGTPVPTDDTSGLSQPDGQVIPGSTSLIVASVTPFRPTGGWVELGGGQVVRFTGISGQYLVGIPATGPGAITTAVLYGSQAIPAPMLVGVAGIIRPLLKGSAIHLFLQRDDPLAQAEEAARAGGDGIIEYLITDTRRGVESLAARCEADLQLFARPIVTVAYATRDLKTKSGKPVVLNLPSQALTTTLVIQEVTIDQIDIARHLAPRFTVRASSVRFSLEDVLRRMIATENKGIR